MNEKEKQVKLPLFGIPRLYPFLKSYIVTIIVMIILGILSSLADSVFPLFNQYALDNFVAKGTLQGLPVFIALYVGILFLQVIDNFICASMCGKVEMNVDRDLRNAAFNHIQELSLAYFNQNNVGYIHARVMSDTGKIGMMVAWRMMDIIWNGSYIVCILIMMLLLNVKLALCVMVLVPVAVLLVTYFQKKYIILNRKIREINSTITGNFNEGITGAKAIKTLVVEDKIQEDFEKDTREMKRTSGRYFVEVILTEVEYHAFSAYYLKAIGGEHTLLMIFTTTETIVCMVDESAQMAFKILVSNSSLKIDCVFRCLIIDNIMLVIGLINHPFHIIKHVCSYSVFLCETFHPRTSVAVLRQ